jgi:hypothetical protein
MRLKVNNVDILGIKEHEANQLQAEIIKATDNKTWFTDDFPYLKELYQLLNGAFQASQNGVHFIHKEKT